MYVNCSQKVYKPNYEQTFLMKYIATKLFGIFITILLQLYTYSVIIVLG